ncbi:MAG: hypothetical protein ACLQAT_20095 [Candidatus Binataceae bacterium]
MKRHLAIMALILLAACAETRGQKRRDQAATNLQFAQLQWNDCSANPKCTGDEMFKTRANLVDAQAEYDRANDQVRQENAILMHSMDQMQQQQQTDQITNAIRANQPAPVFQTMPLSPPIGSYQAAPLVQPAPVFNPAPSPLFRSPENGPLF